MQKIIAALWIVLSGVAVPTLGSGSLLATLVGHTDCVTSVAYSPDGELLASGSWDQTVRLWDSTSATLLHTFTGHADRICSVSFSADGTMIASGSLDATIKLWDVRTGRLFRTLWGASTPLHGCCVDFSPFGWTLASTADTTIKLWDAIMGTLLHTLSGHTQRVTCLAFSPNRSAFCLASGSQDHTIKLWNSSTGVLVRTLTGHIGAVHSIAFSPDGRTLASASSDGTIRLWDVTTGNPLRTIAARQGSVLCVAFSSSGTILASGTEGDGASSNSHDKKLCLWDATTGACLGTLAKYDDPISSVAFSPGGRELAVAALDMRILVWDPSPR